MVEDSHVQRVILLIDHCLGGLGEQDTSGISEDEEMLIFILTSFYLSLKVER